MAIIPSSTNYTDLDFDNLRSRLFSAIRSVFPTWSDDATANFGNLLVESFAFVGDVLSYYQNQQAREGRFGTVQLRKNMIALAKLIGYELENATAYSTELTFTISNASQLTGTVTAASSPVTVRTDDVTNPVSGEVPTPPTFVVSSETEKTATWYHQTTRPNYVVASTGKADQSLSLPYGPFLWASETVTSTGEGTWSRVTSFLSSGPSDLHYRVQVDHNGLGRVIFGDGQNGKVPTGNITASYKTGGGSTGAVEAGALKHLQTRFVDSNGTRAIIQVTNASASSGGQDAETVEQARINAPGSLRSLTRSIAREDYEINAKRVSGVGRCLMLTSNETSAISENTGHLYVVPSSGGVPSEGLLNQVRGVFGRDGQPSPLSDGSQYYPPTTFGLSVLAPSYLTINIEARIWVANGYAASAVRTAIEEALDDFFSPMNADGTENAGIDFGYNYKDVDDNPAGELAWSDLFNVIRDVSGVRKVDSGMLLNGARDDVSINLWQFPAFGTVTLYDGDTGNQI